MIVRSYAEWIAEAPEQYKSGDVHLGRIPVAITSRFGQNQELAASVELQEDELDNWARERDYGRIKYVTLALASHVR